jgi:GT2 family glycosyltransferase
LALVRPEIRFYISDDDVYFLRPDWLEQLVYAYEAAWKEGYRVLGAYNHPYHQPVSWFNFDPKMKVYEVWSLASQSMLMRWDVWDEFGPFDKTPAGKVCQGEDVSFGNRIREAGYKLGVISPALLVNCGITNSFGEKIPGWEMVQKECPTGVLCE